MSSGHPSFYYRVRLGEVCHHCLWFIIRLGVEIREWKLWNPMILLTSFFDFDN
jgi:hypothetical protein